ncbi:MAG: hypothetical protein II947_11130 [Bacteroidaceae bacterium]|nr:hypothetical protein [Bacteroidaceae bacterium]
MKKFLTLALTAFFAFGLSTFAQEEDVTSYIANAGFDEDLTFQSDGSMKEAIATDHSFSDRSWAYVAADSTVYARPKSTSGQNRPDGRKMEAVNGFFGQIQGWTMGDKSYTGKLYYPYGTDATEWVYFGSIPYDLKEQAIPIADDGNTYLTVPEKPEADNGEDNKGFVYLRAGWGGTATYKQVVKLPCAVYRLEYWAININPSAKNGANLSRVVCRKDEFKDETGFNDQVWTKHEIEFTPTAEFTIEFGFKSEGGSGSNPFLCIDGIKLYRIGEADEDQLLMADLTDAEKEITDIIDTIPALEQFEGVVDQVFEWCETAEEADGKDAILAAIKDLKDKKQQLLDFLNVIDEYQALESKILAIAESGTQYPGFSALNDKYEEVSAAVETDGIEDFTAKVEALKEALKQYYFSQEATAENPADYTFLVSSPYFTKTAADPAIAIADDNSAVISVEYPNVDSYTAGSAPSDGTNEGWYIGASGGDQRLNYAQGRVCWNAWRQASTDVSISQDLTNLPNGFYTVSAEMITQPDYVSNQHIFANSKIQTAESPALTVGNWNDTNDGEWTYLTTEKVLVNDGKLTIGAIGSSLDGSTNQTGWFCVTNFRLMYYGPATLEDLQNLYQNTIAEANTMAEEVYYGADKAKFQEVINAFSGAAEEETINLALDTLNTAMAEAKASIDKYAAVMAGSLNDLKQNDYTNNQRTVANAAIKVMESLMAAPDATYKEMDSLTVFLRYYRDNYLPVLGNAEALTLTDPTAIAAMEATIRGQVDKLSAITTFPSTEQLDEYIAELNNAISVCSGAEIIMGGGTDITSFIVNPGVDASSNDAQPNGWTAYHPNGNTVSNVGQAYNGNGSDRYLDSWNGTARAMRYVGYQTITNIPNGIYKIGAMMRASGTPGAEGVYLFGLDGQVGTQQLVDEEGVATDYVTLPGAVYAPAHIQPTNWTEVTRMLNGESGTEYAEDGTDSIGYYTDSYGPIWYKAAVACLTSETGSGTEEEEAIYNANSQKGRGWFYVDATVTVTNNALTIGVTNDSILTAGCTDTTGAPCVPFSGNWFSADNFTLELIQNNEPSFNPATAIDMIEQKNVALKPQGIYNIAGQRLNTLQKGINIVNGKKVFVK